MKVLTFIKHFLSLQKRATYFMLKFFCFDKQAEEVRRDYIVNVILKKHRKYQNLIKGNTLDF